MAILAVLDFDDQGTLKIRNAQNALEELGATVVKSNQSIGQSSQQVKTQKNALDDLVSSARAAQQQTLLQAQALGILNTQVKAGTVVTPQQTRAWADLNAQLSQNTAFAQKFAPQLAAITKEMQAGAVATPQMAKALGQVAAGFQQINSAGSATPAIIKTQKSALDGLVSSARAAQQQTLLQAQALGVLNTQVKAGVAVTPLQTSAWKALNTQLSQNTVLAQQFAPQLATITKGMQAGAVATPQLAAALKQVSQGLAQVSSSGPPAVSTVQALMNGARAAQQQILLQTQALGLLTTQVKAGVAVTPLQTRAWADLNAQLSQNTAFAQKFTPQLAAITKGMQAGAVATPQMAKALGQVSQGFQQVTSAGGPAANTIGTVRAEAGALNTALLTLGAGGLYSFLKGTAELAARIETLGVVTTVTAKNAGYTTAELKIEVETIRNLGITTQEATDAVLQFVRSNLKLSDAAKIARAAQDLAVVSGENSSQTYKRLTAAIQTSEVMLLRQVGIVTTNEAIWRDYAKEIGTTADKLTQMEKRQATVNKILDEAAKVAGAYEISMGTAGKMMSSMARLTEELELKLGKALLPTFTMVVKATFQLTDTLSKMNPEVYRVVAALGAFVAIMLAVAAAIAAAKFLALGAVFASLLTGIGPVVIALAALTAGFIYYKSATGDTLDVTTQQIAALDATNNKLKSTADTYEKLTAKGITLSATTKDVTEDQEKLRKATDDLAKAVPTAIIEFDKLTGTYKLNVVQIRNVIDANADLRRSYLKVAEAQVGDQQKTVDDLDKQRAANIETMAKIEKEIARLTEAAKKEQAAAGRRSPTFFDNIAGAKVALDLKLYKEQLAEVSAATAVVLKDLNSAKTVLASSREIIAEWGGSAPEQINRINEAVTASFKGFAKFSEAAKKLGIDISRLFDPKNQADVGAYRDLLKAIVADVDAAQVKAAASTKQYNKVFEDSLTMIRNTGVATRGQLAGINKGLGEVGKGTEEYRDRLLRAASAIELYNKASEKTKKGLTELKIASEELQKIKLADWLQPFIDEADKMVVSVGKATEATVQKITDDVTGMFRKLADDEAAMSREITDRIFESDREIFEKTVVSKMKAVDQSIYQERRRIEDIERSVGKEIAARERAMVRARADFDEKVRLLKREVEETARAVQLQFDLQAKAALAIRGLQTNETAEVRRAQEAELEIVQEGLRKELAAIVAARLKEIEAEAVIGRRRLTENEQRQISLGNQQLAALDRQKDASFRTQQEIRRDYSVSFQVISGLLEQTTGAVVDGFFSMLSGAKSFKDAFIDIFRSIRDAVLSIFNDIVKGWIKNAIRMSTGQGGIDIGKFFASLLGKSGGGSGALTNAAGVGSSVWGAAAGTGGGTAVGGGAAGSGAGWGAGSAVTGSLFGAAAGGIVGYSVGSYTGSAGKGAAAGAGAGAAVGGAYGGLIGMGVGAVVGGLAGWYGAKKENKKTNDMRDEFIAAAGGLAELNKAAVEAGVTLDKMLKVGTRRELAEEIKKIQAAVEKIELGKLKDDLVKTGTAMDDLGRRAQLVGFDMKRIWDATTIVEFNKAQAELNKLLEEQQIRLAGLARAAQGVQTRLAGLQMTLGKDIESIFKGFTKDQKKSFEEAFEKAREKGFTGSDIDYFIEQMRKAQTGGKDQPDWISKGSLDKFKGTVAEVQAGFDRIGLYAQGTFANIIRETGNWVAAMDAVGPSLDILIGLQEKLGLKASESLQKLLGFRTLIKDNEDIVTSMSGIYDILKGLSDAGRLTQDMFNTLGADAVAQFDALIARGVGVNDALLLSQPTLQALYEAQKRYVFQVDEATQKLLDQAKAGGLIGDEFMPVADRMLDVLILIADALGAKLPAAYQRQKDVGVPAMGEVEDAVGGVNRRLIEAKGRWREMGDAAEAAGRKAEDAATGAAEGSSPTGIKQISVRLDEARLKFRALSDDARAALQTIEAKAGSTGVMADLQAKKDAASSNVVNFTDWVAREREANRQQEAEKSPTTVINITVAGSTVTLKASAIDSEGLLALLEDKLGPMFVDWMKNNPKQAATIIAEAVDRFRKAS